MTCLIIRSQSVRFNCNFQKTTFSILFKQTSMTSFHIVGPLIEILFLVLVSFNFDQFKVDDFV